MRSMPYAAEQGLLYSWVGLLSLFKMESCLTCVGDHFTQGVGAMAWVMY
jgi:hypothetical protein